MDGWMDAFRILTSRLMWSVRKRWLAEKRNICESENGWMNFLAWEIWDALVSSTTVRFETLLLTLCTLNYEQEWGEARKSQIFVWRRRRREEEDRVDHLISSERLQDFSESNLCESCNYETLPFQLAVVLVREKEAGWTYTRLTFWVGKAEW